jgi:phosphate acyltransferase
MNIVLDAMGGDNAPQEIVAGAIKACNTYHDITIFLVGKEEEIRKELHRFSYPEDRIKLITASQVVGMDEAPIEALKKKQDSSIMRGLELVKKQGDAFISAGNTGAVMAGSLFTVGRLKGIKRPSIAITFPSTTGQTLVMDNGANTDSKPEHLLQFAIMGQVYIEQVMGIKDPRVGLLSVGEEKEKGNQLTKESYKLLVKDQRIKNFIGNVEGRDIFNGSCDLVLCDGFVGNVVLKTTEGVASLMFKLLKDALTKNIWTKLAAAVLKPYLEVLKEKTDYRQYGGAPLLGVNGVVIISHGSSDAVAIMNAVRVARETIKERVTELIEGEINKDGEDDAS